VAALASAPSLARNVTACSFVAAAVDLQRNALISLGVQLTDSGETVSLQSEVHVSSTP
jgi:MSHA biogenesis protein MshO